MTNQQKIKILKTAEQLLLMCTEHTPPQVKFSATNANLSRASLILLEEIKILKSKKGEWVFDGDNLCRATEDFPSTEWCKKVVASTHAVLIADGILPIPNAEEVIKELGIPSIEVETEKKLLPIDSFVEIDGVKWKVDGIANKGGERYYFLSDLHGTIFLCPAFVAEGENKETPSPVSDTTTPAISVDEKGEKIVVRDLDAENFAANVLPAPDNKKEAREEENIVSDTRLSAEEWFTDNADVTYPIRLKDGRIGTTTVKGLSKEKFLEYANQFKK